jgi:transcriptional regulator with XRE-family HTH domain
MSASAFGAMLKYFRQKAGLSQNQLAKLINYTSGTIASVETGRRNPSEDLVRRADEAVGADGALIFLYDKLVGLTGFRPGLEDWKKNEEKATLIRGFETTVIPGLLQTEEYARIILRREGAEAVADRIARQEILDKDDAPVVRLIIDEGALRRSAGNAGVMFRQLEHIEAMAAAGKVHVHVLPAGAMPELTGGFSLATVNGRAIGCEDTTTRTEVLTGEREVHDLELTWDRILAEADSPARSLERIRKIREELWKS